MSPAPAMGPGRHGPFGPEIASNEAGAEAGEDDGAGAGTGAVPRPGRTERVVVTAERNEKRPDEVHEHVTVIERGQIDVSAPATIDDVLSGIAAFSLFRRSSSRVSHPTTQGASLRGLGPSGASRTLVLLDGIPINDPFGGWVHWGRVPRSAIERIEVVRGGGSDLWGSAALGGVVHFLTAPPSSPRLGADVRAGSFDELDAGVIAGGERGAVRGSVDVSRFETDGYPVVRSDQLGAIDVPARSERTVLHARLAASASPATELTVTANLFDERRGNGTPLTRNATSGGLLAAGARYSRPSGTWQVRVHGQRQSFSSTFTAQAADRGSERPALDQFDVPSRALGASAQWTSPSRARHELTAGIDATYVDAETNENFFFVGTPEDGRFTRSRRAGGEQRHFGVYARDAIEIGTLWRVGLSGRLDLWTAYDGFRVETDLDGGDTLRDERFADRQRWMFSPKASVRVRLGPVAALTAAIHRSFRAPTVNELYRPFRVRNDVTEANPDLVPESAIGYELGARVAAAPYSASFSIFWNELSDLVTNVTIGSGPGVAPPCGFVPDGGVCRQRQNVERARVAGAEADVRVDLGRDWSFGASYLFTDATFRRAAAQPPLAGKTLPQVPRHRASVSIERVDASVLGGSLRVRFVDDQFEDDLNARKLEDAVVIDLMLRRRVRPGVDVFVAGENLLDRTVEVGRTADGLVTVGAPRSVHAGLRWTR